MWEEAQAGGQAVIPPQALSQLRALTPQQFQQMQARLQQHLPQLQQQLSLQQPQQLPSPQQKAQGNQPAPHQRLLIDHLQQQLRQQQSQHRQILQQQFLQHQQQPTPPPAPRGRQRHQAMPSHLPQSQQPQQYDQQQLHALQMQQFQQIRQQLQPQQQQKAQKAMPTTPSQSQSPSATVQSHTSQSPLNQQQLHQHQMQQQMLGLLQQHPMQSPPTSIPGCAQSASIGKTMASAAVGQKGSSEATSSAFHVPMVSNQASPMSSNAASPNMVYACQHPSSSSNCDGSGAMCNGDVSMMHGVPDSPQKGHRTRNPANRNSHATRHITSTSGSSSSQQQPLPNPALGMPVLDSGVCQAENDKRIELRMTLEKNCKSLVQAVTFDEQHPESLLSTMATACSKGIPELMQSADRDRILARCILQEVTVRQFWQKILEQMKRVHSHDKCNLLWEQQQELTELLTRHARQRSQLKQAHQHQRQECFDKQDRQLRGLHRSLRHVFEALKVNEYFIKDRTQDVVQWCEAVAQASPAMKRRRQMSPSPTGPLGSEASGYPEMKPQCSAAERPNENGAGHVFYPQDVDCYMKGEGSAAGLLKDMQEKRGEPSPPMKAEQKVYEGPSSSSQLSGASLQVTSSEAEGLPGGSSSSRSQAKDIKVSPASQGSSGDQPTSPTFLDLLALHLSTLQRSQEHNRRQWEKEAKEAEDERHLNEFELEIEKLRQQKQQKQLLLFTLHSERQDQRNVISQLHQGGALKRRASEVEKESYDAFQKYLAEQIGYRQRQLRELRAETHRVSKVQRYRRSMQQQGRGDKGEVNEAGDDLWSSSSFTSSENEGGEEALRIQGDSGGPISRTRGEERAKVQEEGAGEDHAEEEDDDSDEEEEDDGTDEEPPDPIKALMCIYDECLTDMVFAEDEEENDEAEDADLDSRAAEVEDRDGLG